jgi:hypothetical protein
MNKSKNLDEGKYPAMKGHPYKLLLAMIGPYKIRVSELPG